jgi:hypothetical protein
MKVLLVLGAVITAMAAARPAAAQTASVILRWRPVAGAQSYELQIAEEVGFKKLVVETRVAQPPYRWQYLPSTPHFWRVRSVDPEGRVGQWSAASSVALPRPPGLLSPADDATLVCGEADTRVRIELARSAVLKEYVVELAADARFTRSLKELTSSDGRVEATLSEPGTYYWRAMGIDLQGSSTSASPTRTFRLVPDGPQLRPVPPTEWTASPTPIPLSWKAGACAQRFQLEVQPEGGRGKTLTAVADKPAHALRLKAAGRYRWRVAGVSKSGITGAWSPWGELEAGRPGPVLSSPADEAHLNARGRPLSVVFEWTGDAAARRYQLELSPDEAFEPGPTRRIPVEATSHAVELAAGRYAWRVRTFDGAGNPSLASATRLLTVRELPALNAPRLTRPEADAVVRVPTAEAPTLLSWGPISGASSYELLLHDAAHPSGDAVTSRTAEQRVTALAEGTVVAKVRGIDEHGQPGPWGPAVAFYVGVPPPASASFRLDSTPLLANGLANTEVGVELRDALGRPIRGARPSLKAAHGVTSGFSEVNGLYVFRYVAPDQLPPGGADTLTLNDRGFSQEKRLPLAPADRGIVAGGRVGFSSNFGWLSSPFVGADVTYRTPLLERRLLVSARLELYGGGRVVASPLDGQPLSVQAQVIPLSALVLGEARLGTFTLRGGLGPSLQLVRVAIGDGWELRPIPAGQASIGLGRVLGPGRASLDVGYTLGFFDDAFARLRTGVLHLSLAYQVGV